MERKMTCWLFVVLTATVVTRCLFAQDVAIHYQLGMSQPQTHLFEVEMTIDGLAKGQKSIDFLLPVWRPGRYVIFDFAGGVQEFSAHEGSGARLAWSKGDKSTWRVVSGGQSTVTVRYKVFADEFDLRTRGLNDRHGFVDGSAVFMYVEKFRHVPVTLQVLPFGDWHVTTGLDAVPGKKNLLRAPSYDYFLDCPLEIGTQKDFDFEAEGKPHRISIFGDGNWEAPKIVEDLKKIVKVCREFWGELPYEHYTFILHCTSQGAGGTEHINSTIMQMRPFIFREETSYRAFLNMAMHEFFHTWNVKQLRPAGIHPYDYTKENYSDVLWVAEGTTSYYTNVLLRRAGFLSVERITDALAGMIRDAQARPGSKVQSLAEASFDAWIKFWKELPNAYNSEVDYYDKGADVSLVLDLEIRQRSANRTSLDEVMRTLYKRFPLSGTGYTSGDFQKVVEELTGSSFADLFAEYVKGTKEINFEKYLAYAGLQMEAKKEEKERPVLGVVTAAVGERTVVRRVVAGSAAYAAGLDRDDELLALNGYRVRSSDLSSRLADYRSGDKVTLTVFRDDQLRQFEVVLQAPAVPDYKVSRHKEPTALQKAIYSSWLGAEWPEEKVTQ